MKTRKIIHFYIFPDSIHHYSIERKPDGTVMIQDGRRFPGPVELVRHHKTRIDGFLTKPSKECKRPQGYPIAWPGVTYLDLEKLLVEAANGRKLKVRVFLTIINYQ